MAATPNHPLVRSFIRDSRPTEAGYRVAVSVLNRYTSWLDDHDRDLVEVTRDDAETYLDERAASGIAASTLHVDWRYLRSLHAWLYAEGETDADPVRRIKAPRVTETDVKVIEESEYRKLISTCDRRSEYGRRDEAMISLLWWSGLRASEVVGLNLADLDWREETLTVGSRTFATKTGKSRRVPLAGETLAALDRYLRRRGDEPGPLFLSKHGDDHDDRRLAPNGLNQMLRRRGRDAKIDRPIGAHEFRRAMATRHKRVGGSDGALMAIAGWSSIRMIDRYTRMEREELAAEEFRRLIDTSRSAGRRGGRRRRLAG